jgi:predicted aspartyl protease
MDGPSGTGILRLALDTGATATVINTGMLVALGYDPALVPDRIQITTGSGVEFVPRIPLQKLVALGQERTNFPVLCHTLPPSAGIDGLLGLDFLRGQMLSIDFRTGTLMLT